jgi:hypothetical protein
MGSDQKYRHNFNRLAQKAWRFWRLKAPFGPQKRAFKEL